MRARASWRDPVLGTPRILELPQGRMRYYDVGEGEPLFFVHGGFVNANLWRKVVPLLAGDFRCVVPDLPFGSHTIPMPAADLSSADGLVDLVTGAIDALDLDRVTLVGMDTGGAICQFVVTRRPERIARLVLTSCDYRDNFPPRMFTHLKLMARMPDRLQTALFTPMRLSAPRRLPFAFGWLAHTHDRAAEDTWVLPALEDRAVLADTKRMLRLFDRELLNRTADLLGTFDGPALVAWSADDKVFPVADGRRLAAELGNGRFELIEGARTFSMEDQPERLAAAIAVFMAETSRAAPVRQSA
ncbi:MAG TPA: alpha/beta hydrolase [Thermoleophilaceae bacterium]|nr:alpha/beta hydrolase [Thermoleophilaceae bacterium]